MPRSWVTPPGAVTQRFWAMDSEILVILPQERAPAVHLVGDLFERWESQLSRFRPDSALSRLNRADGRPVAAGEPLLGVMRQALAAARATGGIFDPTLGDRIADLGYSTTFAALPEVVVPKLELAPPAAAWRDIRIGPLGVITVPPGVAVDLGGIAKGMAVDAACAALAAAGIGPALVSAGGDLAVHGALPSGGWPVALETSDGQGTVTLSAGGLATSSTEMRRWQSTAGPMHHLLDPRTGRPAATDLVRATVHAPTCEQAEVAAKTALILGLDAGSDFLRRTHLSGLLTTRARSHPIGAWPGAEQVTAA